jgi:O-antigen/teichoic acid export membrane protein
MSKDGFEEMLKTCGTTAPERRSSVFRNSILNMAGSVIPVLVSLVTIPLYLRLIGDVRFGVLALVWVFLSYAGLFEMGLGRATSKYVAELRSGLANERELLFWTAACVNLALGIVGGILLWAVAGATLPLWVKSDAVTQAEVARALPWLAAAVPVATLSSVLIGALEGCEQFGAINLQQIGATIVFQLVPLGVASWVGPRTDLLIGAAVISRIVSNLPLLYSCARHVPLRGLPKIDRVWLRRLFSYGAWITVSGIVGPVIATLDRFIISFARGPQAVTYYSIPYNFASKLLIVSGSLNRALFPRFSAEQPFVAQEMAVRSVFVLNAILTPIVVNAILGADWFFRLWLGTSAAARCTPAAQLFLVGFWINALAGSPSTLLQARGRPDLTAKFHLIELVPFVGILWAGIHFGGVAGAAAVGVLRVSVDTALLFWGARIARAVGVRMIPSVAVVFLALAFSVGVHPHLVTHVAIVLVFAAASLLIAKATSPDLSRLIMAGLKRFPIRGNTGE